MGVEIDLVYEGELHCQATHGPSRQKLVTDAPLDNGGKGSAFSPTDLVATALGSCMLTIMGMVAARKKLDMRGTTAHVVKEMVATPSRRIGKVIVKIRIPSAKNWNESERAMIEQAAKACPVKQSLHPETEIDLQILFG